MTTSANDLRRRIALLEGDHKAFFESSQATMKANSDKINELRAANKSMALKLKALTGRLGVASDGRLQLLDTRISDAIKRHNLLRAQALQKEQELALLTAKLDEVASAATATEGPLDHQLRELDTQLDRAHTKEQEATHMAQLYAAILQKLEQDRLQYETRAAQLEATIAAQAKQLAELEAIGGDAQAARDAARASLAAFEHNAQATRKAQEAERSRLYQLTEERRRQQEALERRQRLKSGAIQNQDNDEDDLGDDAQFTLSTYEHALRRIQTVTGVVDLDDVVARFAAQETTEAELARLQARSTEARDELRLVHARAQKQHEALKYSGQARSTSGARMLREFEQHLQQLQTATVADKETDARLAKRIVAVRTGVDLLKDKVAVLPEAPPADAAADADADADADAAAAEQQPEPAAAAVPAIEVDGQPVSAAALAAPLDDARRRLHALWKEIEAHGETLQAAEAAPAPVVLPEHNTRVAMATGQLDPHHHGGTTHRHRHAKGADSDSDGDDDVTPRALLKQQSEALAASAADPKAKKK